MHEPPVPGLMPAPNPQGFSLVAVAQLDHSVLSAVVRRLDPDTLRCAALTCRTLRALASDTGPGLGLDLYPHQVGTLSTFLSKP